MTSRAALQQQLAVANAQLDSLNGSLSEATQRAEAAESALAAAQVDLSQARARVAELEADAKDLHSAMVDELAGLGVDRNDLVAGDAQGKGGPIEAAYEDFRSAPTPEAKAAAHRRLKAELAKQKQSAGMN